MRPKQYVIPQLLPHHETPASDAALDATEWASRFAGVRARVQMLSDEHLAYYLPRFVFADLMGLVVCRPYSVELQEQITKVLFPKFLEDGFSRHCIRCGERLWRCSLFSSSGGEIRLTNGILKGRPWVDSHQAAKPQDRT